MKNTTLFYSKMQLCEYLMQRSILSELVDFLMDYPLTYIIFLFSVNIIKSLHVIHRDKHDIHNNLSNPWMIVVPV